MCCGVWGRVRCVGVCGVWACAVGVGRVRCGGVCVVVCEGACGCWGVSGVCGPWGRESIARRFIIRIPW